MCLPAIRIAPAELGLGLAVTVEFHAQQALDLVVRDVILGIDLRHTGVEVTPELGDAFTLGWLHAGGAAQRRARCAEACVPLQHALKREGSYGPSADGISPSRTRPSGESNGALANHCQSSWAVRR